VQNYYNYGSSNIAPVYNTNTSIVNNSANFVSHVPGTNYIEKRVSFPCKTPVSMNSDSMNFFDIFAKSSFSSQNRKATASDKYTADTTLTTMHEEELSNRCVVPIPTNGGENLSRCKSQLVLNKLNVFNNSVVLGSPDKLSETRITLKSPMNPDSNCTPRQSKKSQPVNSTEAAIKQYARGILEKILLDKSLETGSTTIMGESNSADAPNSLINKLSTENQYSLRMIL
jgi:hypothetical protein